MVGDSIEVFVFCVEPEVAGADGLVSEEGTAEGERLGGGGNLVSIVHLFLAFCPQKKYPETYSPAYHEANHTGCAFCRLPYRGLSSGRDYA